MLKSKSFAAAAAVAGVLATTSPAAAATSQASDESHPPGNCAPGVLCIWPDFNPWGTASLVTDVNWSGQITGLYFYNRTSRGADIVYSFTFDTSGRTWTTCVNPGGGDLYMHANVMNVTFRGGACTW